MTNNVALALIQVVAVEKLQLVVRLNGATEGRVHITEVNSQFCLLLSSSLLWDLFAPFSWESVMMTIWKPSFVVYQQADKSITAVIIRLWMDIQRTTLLVPSKLVKKSRAKWLKQFVSQRLPGAKRRF